MATIADLVVKKADNVTNITFTAIAGAAGDKLAALWRSETAATMRANRPTFSLRCYDNGSKTARRSTGQVVFPIVRTINTVETLVEKVIFDFSCIVPNSLTDTEIAESVSQSTNLVVAAAIVSSIKSGVAPN